MYIQNVHIRSTCVGMCPGATPGVVLCPGLLSARSRVPKKGQVGDGLCNTVLISMASIKITKPFSSHHFALQKIVSTLPLPDAAA